MFEEKEHNNNSNKTLTILAVFVLVATVIGVAIAAYTWSFTGGTNRISTGNVTMSLLESNDVIDLANALPITDEEGTALANENEVFDFAITTHASGTPGPITYDITLNKLEVDSGYAALKNKEVKIYLVSVSGENENQVVAPTKMSTIFGDDTETPGSTSGTLKSGVVHSHATADKTETTKYRIKMWVDIDTDASSWTENTKLQYKIKVGTAATLGPIA